HGCSAPTGTRSTSPAWSAVTSIRADTPPSTGCMDRIAPRSGCEMDFSLTDEQSLLQRVVRDFARQELLPRYAEWDRAGVFPRDLWRRMGELGLTGARVPHAY